MSVLFLWMIYISLNCIIQVSLSTTLSPGTVIDDDFTVYDSNTGNGWINGDITIETTTNTYHGLFDGDSMNEYNISNNTYYNGISELSRTDIQLNVEQNGKLMMNFTLIFSCDIFNKTDIITVSIGDTITKQYYFIDTYDYSSSSIATNEYPFKTPTFTIDLFDSDPILYQRCNQFPGDSTVWIIHSSIISPIINKNTQIPISFKSSFDYDTIDDDEEKFWAVYNIKFTVFDTSDSQSSQGNNNDDDKNDNNLITIIAIIVVAIFVLIAIIFLIWYCKKKRQKENDQLEMTENGMTWRYTVKGQKVTDKTQLRSAFDTPLGGNNNYTNNYNNANFNQPQQQQQQQHIVARNSNNNYNNNNNNNMNHPPSLNTIMGRPPSGIRNEQDSDEDSILRMQNKYADE